MGKLILQLFTVAIVMASLSSAVPNVEHVTITSDLAKRLESPDHTSMFYLRDPRSNYQSKVYWSNTPAELDWKWDDPNYTKLPLSSEFYKTQGDGSRKPRWTIVEEELRKLRTPNGQPWGNRLLKAMQGYNEKMIDGANFQILNDPELQDILNRAIPIMADHAMKLSLRLAKPIPYLKQGEWHTLYFTRNLVASLLANAFFNTIPHHLRDDGKIPHFHFLILFHRGGESAGKARVKVEKIKAVAEYFNRLNEADGNSIISYERRSLSEKQSWSSSRKTLIDVQVQRNGGIEDAGEDMLQVDFANRRIGGGVLGDGMTQEELRFMLSPELIVSRLFTEVFLDDEAMVITGTKQFSSSTGYMNTFRWRKIEGRLPAANKDNLGREFEQVVAIDALKFSTGATNVQFSKSNIDRELHKSYVGYKQGAVGKPIATGNWGGGVFNGDRQLKFLIQWMSASQNDRPLMVYYTLHNEEESRSYEEMRNLLKNKNVTVGQLYNILLKYEREGNGRSVFEFVKRNV